MTANAVLLGSLFLIFSMPAVWFLCRAILGRILGTAGFIFYLLITLFPYRWLFPDQTSFCTWVAAPPSSLFGPGWVVLVLLVIVAGAAAAFIYRRELPVRLKALPGTRVVILVLLTFSAVTQVAVRYGSRSPKSVDGGWHKESNPYKRAVFWNIRYGGGDHALHITPAGLFRGVGAPKDYNKDHLKINRRSVGPFLYAQFTPYLDPYASAVAVNFLFYLIIVLGGYRLARIFGQTELLSAGFALLLSANHFVLWRTVMPYFYLPFDAAFVALLLGLYLLRPLDQNPVPHGLLQFGSLMALAAISYDANLPALAVLLWTVVRIVRRRRIEGHFDGRVAAAGFFSAVLPVFVQRGWEALLKSLNVAGNTMDVEARSLFMSKLVDLPAHLLNEPRESLEILDQSLSRLIFMNRMDTNIVEYCAVLGGVGVVAFFALLPRYLAKKHFHDLLALTAASVIIGVIVSLAAALPPRSKIDLFATDPMRTSSAVYATMVLGQTVAIYHFVDRLGARGRFRLRTTFFAVSIGLVWILSFGRLWWS